MKNKEQRALYSSCLGLFNSTSFLEKYMQIKGLDEFSKSLKKLSENAKKLEDAGPQSVPLTELMGPDFISARTRFPDVQTLFSESGFKIDTPEDFNAIPEEDWDRFIQSETKFSSWKEMITTAGALWTKKQLGL